jgi:alpha-D-xyloside xylohydrolase
MLRTLFFEFPNDPTSWLVDDEYFFGHDLLVAPLFDSTSHRQVYLPPGKWIDYQTGRVYAGGAWSEVPAGTIPIVLLVRDHAVIPHIGLAQNTAALNWSDIELRVFSTDSTSATGVFALPHGSAMTLSTRAGAPYALAADPMAGRVHWRITSATTR